MFQNGVVYLRFLIPHVQIVIKIVDPARTTIETQMRRRAAQDRAVRAAEMTAPTTLAAVDQTHRAVKKRKRGRAKRRLLLTRCLRQG